MAVPGIHVAVHSEERLLSAGAWLNFSQHVNTLLLAGRMEEARTLWGSVFEIVHLGVDPALPVLQDQRLPPLRRIPCCVRPCQRCEGPGVAFVSRLWERGRAELSSLKRPLRRVQPGSCSIRSHMSAWTFWRCRHVARACDRLLRGMDGISISLFFACVVRHLPRYSGCLTCGYNWRNGCRGHLSFCAMCGSSDDED